VDESEGFLGGAVSAYSSSSMNKIESYCYKIVLITSASILSDSIIKNIKRSPVGSIQQK
jgi:ABC-type uncharacterized transport system ATPase subunit